MKLDDNMIITRKESARRRRLMVRKLYSDGMTIKNIAKMLDRPYHTIYQDVRMMTDWKSEKDEEIQRNIKNRQNEVKKFFNEDYSLAEIAKELGVSRTTVRKDAQTMGISFGEKERVKREENVERFKTLYRKGWTNKEIAKEIGVSHPTVVNYCHELGYKPRRKMSDEEIHRKMRIKELYEKQKPVKEIAQDVDVNLATVYRHVKKIKQLAAE